MQISVATTKKINYQNLFLKLLRSPIRSKFNQSCPLPPLPYILYVCISTLKKESIVAQGLEDVLDKSRTYPQCLEKFGGKWERSVLSLGFLCKPCYMRDSAWSWIIKTKIKRIQKNGMENIYIYLRRQNLSVAFLPNIFNFLWSVTVCKRLSGFVAFWISKYSV